MFECVYVVLLNSTPHDDSLTRDSAASCERHVALTVCWRAGVFLCTVHGTDRYSIHTSTNTGSENVCVRLCCVWERE